MSDIYPLRDGCYLSADLAQANAPLLVGVTCDEDDCDDDENCECRLSRLKNGRRVRIRWIPTPYQTADARHSLKKASRLVRAHLRDVFA